MAYTYLIGWRTEDKWYYGYRSVKRDPAEDLWKRYFTSSKIVDQYRAKYGEPDVIRVHKIFEEPKTAREYEERFLRRVNAKVSRRWLNLTNGNREWVTKPGFKMSEKQKDIRRAASTGLRAYHKEGVVKKFKNDPGEGWTRGYPPNHHGLIGKRMSEEARAKMRKAWETRAPESEETRRKKSESHKGVSRPDHSARMKAYWASR